ncbi:M20/M25/M40 family metallo-hydrolase [Jeotgalicoccus sp. ATCC 8456]|uniref:M20/M25/M40 family metallo-hydrolase n=1 Tax=Jeotgalicoccus sp. ATCC 8456 TaxID=946435 RepID=UPI0018E5D0D7|nr:M20/M25/M40 family metallo-hydrolase [Jeotgalicoccus sp. ATCC 8456]QQD84585.1 M20/M25/M40 family metallo-hydrolase [Jeotgalicoccus sp. ATCC 8456]
MEYLWQKSEDIEALLYELVSWNSLSGSQGEIDFPHKLKDKLMALDYFSTQDDKIRLFDAGKNCNALTALYKNDETKDTVVLISHFDTVGVDEYGQLSHLAFDPVNLTAAFETRKDLLTEDTKVDLETGDFVFGRGVMDMKPGLALHMHILEQAIKEEWPINICLVTVPDEEVASAGMLRAVPGLVQIKDEYDLNIRLFLNGEPSFTQEPLDNNHYIYSGSIGKIMPAALFYGIPTHAGEPLNGITAHFLSSYLNKEMEFTNRFQETYDGETTPLPICLQSNDLKENYDVQTSHHAYSLYNVFTMNQTARDVMGTFKEIAEDAMHQCRTDYLKIAETNGIEPFTCIRIMEYHEVLEYFIDKYSLEEANQVIEAVLNQGVSDQRKTTVLIADRLMEHCQELAPATVLMFAPPYMPAVNSSDDDLVQKLIAVTKETFKENFNYEVTNKHYFNGISDLSYVNYQADDDGWEVFVNNAPLWGETYKIPFKDMQILNAPVMNIGPFGKDAHKMTERLHKANAFEMMPQVLKTVIRSI